MFSYINIFKPKKVKLDINKLSKNLYYECWENNVRPIDVMNDIKNKKYEDEVKRIKKSDTKFPIIIDTNNNIIDGVHRYVKYILNKKKTINVIIFDEKMMKKFIISKQNEKKEYQICNIIELFIKRFIKL
jgi:disulfide oxidoreductase YuzD